MDEAPKDLNTEFNVGSNAIEKLLSKATVPEGGRQLDYYSGQEGRIGRYSIQFQGCHQIRHWNKDADEDDELRVATKRLVRFRLVPYEKCSQYNPWVDIEAFNIAKDLLGQADFGDYVVDLSTFLEAYLEAKYESETADVDDAAEYYVNNYYKKYYYDDDSLSLEDYTQCAAFNFVGDDDGYEYYVGPYCARQGGEIRLNLFTDNTCSTLAKCNNGSSRGSACYTSTTGLTLPYSEESIIENPCVPCSENFQYLETVPTEDFDFSTYSFGNARDSCANLYDMSGKCEQHMKNGKYDYACKYINGIEIGVSKEGYAVGIKRSLPADIFLTILAVSTTFVGMYIFYLRHKLKVVEKKIYSKNFYVPSRM